MNAEMTYSQSARGVQITEKRARQELDAHGFTSADDVTEALEASKTRTAGIYSASKLLEWLGY